MANSDKDRMLEIIKTNETIMLDYIAELKEKVENKSAKIDDIEQIMLKTMKTLRHSVVAIAGDILSEEGLKKTRPKPTRDAGRK